VLPCVMNIGIDIRHVFKRVQLFVGGLMLYLRYMCVFAHSGVQHTLCWFCLVLFCFLFFFLRLDMLPVSMDCLFVVAP
jgi:hypothetical protein